MPRINKVTKIILRRLLRRRNKLTENSLQHAADSFDKNFIGRFVRLKKVRRFTTDWLLLIVLLTVVTAFQTVNLSSSYQTSKPISGGTYHEGIAGTFSTANPLYATGSVDMAVSRLVFSGLLKYDENNDIVPDLADSFKADETGKIYTVELRENLKWQDGHPLTADDVLFTYKMIQNPDARSSLLNSMRGVEIKKIDEKTVQFRLQSALGSFPLSLLTGIIPKHILEDVPAVELRTASFNTVNPVGAGPFMWKQLSMAGKGNDSTSATITLERYDKFHAGGPKLNRFVIHTYDDDENLVSAFNRREIRAIVGIDSAPLIFDGSKTERLYSFQTTAAIMTFFNTQSSGPLSSADVRKGLLLGTNRKEIIHKLKQTLRIVREPVLVGQFAYDVQYAQSLYNFTAATEVLDKAGWRIGQDGIRSKDGKKLEFQLYAEDSPDNNIITRELKNQWNNLGVDVTVTLQPSMYFQTTLETRSYDAVVNGISIGNDPDVYAYWHSSQIDNGGLNYSNYKSSTADISLEAGRTRQNDAQRALKYKPFLKAWQADTPAIAMFRPRVYYITRGPVYGLSEHIINTDADRYYSVNEWQINTAMVNDK